MKLTHKQLIERLIYEYGSLEEAFFNDSQEGICHNCGEIDSPVEPDARNYKCPACQEHQVFGIEETIIMIG